MTLRLYDTRAQQLRDFVPLDSENITMYVCGPTVQSGPHIGHVRAALSFDLLRRWLAHRYGRVTFVRNVTDIDDKVLANATDAEPWWALAYRMEQEFTAAYAGVGILAPTYEPRATASIPQMQELIATLIERGHAYPAPDGSGDVYFDVRSWPSYGELTNQSVDAMEAAEDADPRGKRNPQDFALWKGAKADEQADATWQSPWGAGRPGWHIECSAMSKRYLGPEFDIHGGGLDLRFPHHENELAQSTAAGDGFAQYWVHNGLVTVGGQKMSKSLGNFTLAAEVLDAHDPLVVRYALAAAHYRSSLDLTESSWTEAEAALGRIRTFLDRGQRLAKPGWSQAKEGLPTEFWDAMNDDLAVPRALAAIHSSIRSGNALLDDGKIDEARQDVMDVIAMTNILGLNPHASAWSESGDGATASALDALVQTMITQRAQARADKDWAAADRIRDAIAAAGITLEDSPAGTHWSIDG
ncbi:cysteine--tRNA ligase [Microbacterium foliorum]|uniref:cysteine--tRNA ligase n=1 Tax=Microbacterium foliorum TaxID=104336 RepID=UPI0028D33B21|nr:cysteine--tRNA ligase [Microbacterium foliorum]